MPSDETVPLPRRGCANVPECFDELVGGTVIGVLRDALPVRKPSVGSTTLVMHDGSGLTLNGNGAFWREKPEDVAEAIENMRSALQEVQRIYKALMDLAGAHGSARNPKEADRG